MGIARGEEYAFVSSFCFVFPDATGPVPDGHIHSQTIVSSPGHKFLVVNQSDLQEGRSCEELVRRAKVIEPLTERSLEVIAYDLTLNVEPSMSRQQISTIIARCGEQVSAEYIVELTSPGGLFERHFACSDRGLLSGYLWCTLVVCVTSSFFYSACRMLHHRQAHNDISAIFFTSGAFYGARVLLFTVHLFVYARNGMGLGMLLFVSQFLDFLSTSMLMCVIMALVHGVYILRPCVPVGSVERQMLLRIFGAFTGTYLLFTLVSGFRVDDELLPLGVPGAVSWPYIGVRVYSAIFCFRTGMRQAAEAAKVSSEKSQLLGRFSIVALVWLLSIPMVMFLSNGDTWPHSELYVEHLNFGVYGILLHEFWPSRFGFLFSCVRPSDRANPYTEFSLG